MAIAHEDLARTTLAVIFIVGLLAASFWILRPFLSAIVWAAMIVVATWPVMLRVQARLWRRRWLAVLVMSSVLLLVFVVPLSIGIGALAAHADTIGGWAQSIGALQLPAPPDWVRKLPLAGERLASRWAELAASGPDELRERVAPLARDLARWLVQEAGNVGLVALQFLLTVLICAFFYARGEALAGGVSLFAGRLAGERGIRALILAAQAIRGVALGVVLTALIQAVFAGIGLAIAGVPFAGVLTGLMFLLAVAQIGAGPVLACAVAWLYWKGDAFWGTALLLWSIPACTVDNVLRPLLIKMGADLPLALVFAGVVGGLISFGLVGIFVGPVVLAVAYTLISDWVKS